MLTKRDHALEDPGISPKMSDPKWPIFVLYVLWVFPSSCPALDRVARNLAVNVLEPYTTFKNRINSNNYSKSAQNLEKKPYSLLQLF